MVRRSRSPHILGVAAVLAMTVRVALAQPAAERVQLDCADGVKIYAFWYAQGMDAKAPAVLLVHNPGASHTNWAPLLQPLRDGGFRVLAVDLRGHGESKDLNPEIYDQITRREAKPYADMIHDVEAAVQWLTSVQKLAPERIALVGGEYSADLALQALARNRRLAAVVAMSPSSKYFGFPLEETAKKIKTEPILVLVPKQILNDGASQMQAINRDNPGFELKIYPRYDHHGVHMLGLSWKVEETIVQWLGKVLATKP